MVEAVKGEFKDTPFLWQGNKSLVEPPFGENGRRLPNVPHGLNDYSDVNNIAFLSALNPKSDHFRFLKTRGVDDDSVRRAVYCSAVYQSVMRSSIRDPQNLDSKIAIVPDISVARYLQDRFPRSIVEKLTAQIPESEISTKAGRHRKYSSAKARQIEYRRRKRQNRSSDLLRLQGFPYLGEKSCGSENTAIIGDKKGIEIITNFVTHHGLCGTFYKHIKSGSPCAYLYCQNTELFIDVLAFFHSRKLPNKDANLLLSPAIFDPNIPNELGTKHGLENIVAMRHLWMDFENGDLKPDELSELFPQIRLLVFNTYNHSKEKPRFRVIIPFDEPISSDDYSLLYNNIIEKIEDAGYSVGRGKGHPQSGLDVSKKTPTSLFYLPCQSQDPTQSFFKDYNDDKRKLLDPFAWIENTVIRFPKTIAPQTPQQPRRENIDEVKVEAATKRWRGSRENHKTGNKGFFNYALSLRSAGMSPEQIERKLQEQAQFGRSPDERKEQIPWIMKSLQQSSQRAA